MEKSKVISHTIGLIRGEMDKKDRVIYGFCVFFIEDFALKSFAHWFLNCSLFFKMISRKYCVPKIAQHPKIYSPLNNRPENWVLNLKFTFTMQFSAPFFNFHWCAAKPTIKHSNYHTKFVTHPNNNWKKNFFLCFHT